MKRPARYVSLAFTLGLCLTVSLLWLLHVPRDAAQAQPSASVIRVAATGSDAPGCGGAANPCRTVQYAVDQATSGDEIRVAAGTYTDVHTRPRDDIETTGVVTQMVYISKTVTVRGGYTTANWTAPDPNANLTILNAQGQGRVIYIIGNSAASSGSTISPTIEGLRITGGNPAGMGTSGGGVCAISATVTLSGNHVFSNVVSVYSAAGGIAFYHGNAIVSGNTIAANAGIGLSLDDGTGTIDGNTFSTNAYDGLEVKHATAVIQNNILSLNGTFIDGGSGLSVGPDSVAVIQANQVLSNASSGLVMGNSFAVIQGNSFIGHYQDGLSLYSGSSGTVYDNLISANRRGIEVDRSPTILIISNKIIANSWLGMGGGLYLHGNRGGQGVTLIGNKIEANRGTFGGGVYMDFSDATLIGNILVSNTTTNSGGGLYITDHCSATLVNNIVVSNVINNDPGAGLYVRNSTVRLIHNTIVNNRGGDGSGIYVTADDGGMYTFGMTNTIVASQTHGVTSVANTALTTTLESTLWSGNGQDWNGTNVVNTRNYTGDPAFVNPAASDYHIGPSSAAIDRGVNAGVRLDIDDEPRFGVPDLGADEYWPPGLLRHIYLPLVLPDPE